MELPVVDYNSSDFDCQFNAKFKQFNFCLLKNTPQIDTNYSFFANFFNTKEKNNFLFDKIMHDGLFPVEHSEIALNSKKKDYKEFFHFYPWGRYPESMAKISSNLFLELNKIAKKSLKSIEANLSSEIVQNNQPLSKIIQQSNKTLLRISHYPKYKEEIFQYNPPRAYEHTDINLITVQPPASISGLECKMPDGSWQIVDNNEHVFVGCGEMLTKYTLNTYKSCLHRVSPPKKINNFDRISIMFFLHARSNIILDNKTANYHLNNRRKELGY